MKARIIYNGNLRIPQPHNDDGMVAIPNSLIFNDKLTPGEKGLMMYFYSKPKGWKIDYEEMNRENKESIDELKACVASIKKKGCLTHVVE